MRIERIGLVAGLLRPATFAAQRPAHDVRPWDVPAFLAPGRHDDVGLHPVSPNRADRGVVGGWRQSGGSLRRILRG